MLAYEPFIARPERRKELHRMRIAAKHFRYTMEAFAPAYGGRLDPWIRAAQRIQTELGEIHDCDVWIHETLPKFLADERARRRARGDQAGHHGAAPRPPPAAECNLSGVPAALEGTAPQEGPIAKTPDELNSNSEGGRMKVALIADIHANLPALQAVLAHARKRKVKAIWNAGDFVGYGPFPDEVVRRVRAEKALSIAGNYDLKVLRPTARRARRTRTPKSDTRSSGRSTTSRRRAASTWPRCRGNCG